MSLCPCGSEITFAICCGLYLNDQKIPPTPEALMRSRYTAYSLENISYIVKTMRGKLLENFDENNAHKWAKRVIWIDLSIIETKIDSSNPNKGYIEFIARYIDRDKLYNMHEISIFNLIEGRWFYVDGYHPDKTKISVGKKITRNECCPCNSQKKFKNCHGKNKL